MTSHETALAAAWRTYADRYDAYRKLQSGLSLKSWLECHGDKTPAEIAFSEAISSYLAALPADDLVERGMNAVVVGRGRNLIDGEATGLIRDLATALTASRADGERLRADLERAGESNANLFNVIAGIREKSGCGTKPMLGELADAIGAKVERLTRERDYYVGRDKAADEMLKEAEAKVADLLWAANHIMPYLEFTIGDESLGHHPTMPSAVAAFRAATIRARGE